MPNLDEMAGRPAQYLAETGTPQLMGGLVLVTLGTSALIQSLLTAKPAYRDYGLVAQYAGLCCVGIVFWRLTALKRRIVFPRGGYAAPRGRRWSFLRAALIGLLSVVYGETAHNWPKLRFGLESPLLWPAFMIVFAIICLDSGWRQKSALAMWMGVYLACLAPLAWLLPADNYARSAALMLAIGAPTAAAGALRLRRFVRANPMPAETSDE